MLERSPPLRVAYLVNQYPAGSHTFIRREIHALESQGIVVQRIALRGWDTDLIDPQDLAERTLTQYVLVRGVRGLLSALVRTALVSPRRLLKAARLAWLMSRESDRPLAVHLAYLAEACVIRRWTSAQGALHLHAHFATNPAELAMLAHELDGPPYSFTAHGSDIMDRPAQIGLQHTVRHAAFVVAVCSFGRSQFFKWVPHGLWDRVRVVRCGLDPEYGKTASPATQRSRRLLCIGRLSKEKGQLLLVQAAQLVTAAGIEFELALAGDGPMRAEIEEQILRLGLAARVRITGWLDSAAIERELGLARALVVPSLSEGLPVVIMEAMAARRPVIAPYLAGIPELVRNGSNGWLFPAGDVVALAAAMQACLAADDNELRLRGDTARTDVLGAHDVNAETHKLAQLFDAAVAASGQRSEI